MKNLLKIILVVFGMTLLISASVVSTEFIITQPKTPESTIIFRTSNVESVEKITKHIKNGYQVQSITPVVEGYQVIVIMVKY